jgi:biopolymer transport protein ExbD
MIGRHRRNADAGPGVVLPITPMLDMAFQLLTFFIFTYHPSEFEGQMELSLPSDNTLAADKPENVDPNVRPDRNRELELKTDLTVIVRTQQNGQNYGVISSVAVQDAGNVKDLGSDLDNLQKYLRELAQRVDPKQGIKLQGDSRLKWDSMVQVMDRCRLAGFKNVSFAPPQGYGLTRTRGG